jgi:hypothetical protein
MGGQPAISMDSHFFHHLTSSHLVAPPDKFTVHVANDLAIYAAEMLIGPLLRILNAKVEKIRFDFRSEATLKFTKVDPNGNSDEHSIAEARVDLFITSTRRSATTTAAVHPHLSPVHFPRRDKRHLPYNSHFEFKTPHTLNKDDFATRLLRSGTGLLRWNAAHLGKQTRKYMAAAKWGVVMLFDGLALMGLQTDVQDVERCQTGQQLDASRVYYAENKTEFLSTLLAMAFVGLNYHELLTDHPSPGFQFRRASVG